MKIKVVAENIDKLWGAFEKEKEYLVVAMIITTSSNIIEVYCKDGDNVARKNSIEFFDVVDPRISKYWVIKRNTQNDIILAPAPFKDELYFDNLIDNDYDCVQLFDYWTNILKNEWECLLTDVRGLVKKGSLIGKYVYIEDNKEKLGGYSLIILNAYNTPTNDENAELKWFSSVDELKKYFIDAGLEVLWIVDPPEESRSPNNSSV